MLRTQSIVPEHNLDEENEEKARSSIISATTREKNTF